MNMVPFKQDKVILSTRFLAALDQGLEVIRLDVRYPEVQGLAQVMFTMFIMCTIGSTGYDTGYTKSFIDRDDQGQDFLYALGYCQLDAFFKLEHVSP